MNKARTDTGCTLLHVACQNAHANVVKLLLKRKGIKRNKVNNLGGYTTVFSTGLGESKSKFVFCD